MHSSPVALPPGALSYLLAFSLISNGRSLLKRSRPGPNNIGCLNGLRVLSILWVVLGHRYKWGLDAPFTNLAVMPKVCQGQPSRSRPLIHSFFFYYFLSSNVMGYYGLFSCLPNYNELLLALSVIAKKNPL